MGFQAIFSLAMSEDKRQQVHISTFHWLYLDRAGEAVLEHLLCLKDNESYILGLPKLREIVATAAWYLWYERRKLTHGEDTQTASQISLAGRGLAANFIISCSPKPVRKMVCWVKPRYGYVKLNVDAGFDIDTLEGTVVQFSGTTKDSSLLLLMENLILVSIHLQRRR